MKSHVTHILISGLLFDDMKNKDERNFDNERQTTSEVMHEILKNMYKKVDYKNRFCNFYQV